MGTARRDPAPAAASRKAVALGVALALHAAVVVAWDLGAPVERGRALTTGAAQPSVTMLRLHPLPRPAEAPAPEAPAPEAQQAAVGTGLATDIPAPATPAAEPGAQDVGAGTLERHGGSWSPGYPDLALETPQMRLVLALSFDDEGRVTAAMPVGAATHEVLVQHIQDQLPQVRLAGAQAGTLRHGCLELVFDTQAAQVQWRLLGCAASGAGRRP